MLDQLTALVTQHGLLLVFVNVFLVQVGAPVPAVPTLLVAGALVMGGGSSLPMIVLVAVAASLLGDLVWYAAGRIYGLRVLQLLCRISISPDSCVRQTENRFARWGAPSLIFAKFVPGFSTVAPPLAGAMRVKLTAFLGYSAISAALWAGLAAGAGMLFFRQIDWALAKMAEMGVYALILIGVALALFVAVKWWERRRFFKALRMARVAVADLYRMMQTGEAPVVVDVRSAVEREIDPRRVPGAIGVDLANIDAHVAQLPPDRDIILYCT
jgi:membrane protein DedA with SNARE-associated domain